MRDGINFARLGVPAVALITEEFWPQGEFVAASLGMPDIPKVKLPHPIAGTGRDHIKKVVNTLFLQLVEFLIIKNGISGL